MKLTIEQESALARELMATFRKHGVTRWRGEYDIVGERAESHLHVREAETATDPLPEPHPPEKRAARRAMDASPYGVYPKP